MYVMNADQLMTDDAFNSAGQPMWPCGLVVVNNQSYTPVSSSEFYGQMDATVQLYGDITVSNNSIDQEWALLSNDAHTVMDNVAKNRSLVENNQAHAVDIDNIRLSDYSSRQIGQLQGTNRVRRDVLFTIQILPFDET